MSGRSAFSLADSAWREPSWLEAATDRQSIIPPQAAEPDTPASQDADAPASPDTEKAS